MATIEGLSVLSVLLADQSFPLQCHLMKPFPLNQIFQGRLQELLTCLSSARHGVENAFGRMRALFRMVDKGLECDIDNVNIIVCTCVLHNICESMSGYCDAN